MQDAELEAMTAVHGAVAGLDAVAATRVLRWALDRYGGPEQRLAPHTAPGGHATAPDQHRPNPRHPDMVADFYSATAPSSEAEKTLVIAYWLQEVVGKRDIDALEVNAELKLLGHRIANITRALSDLINARPQLVIQTRKSGTTRQARKEYRVTAEGLRRVREMMGRQQRSGSP